jgi:glycosyltransferase involved in cell wall biosynthesis
MKLVVQIPCYDEAEQLPGTLAQLPRRITGVDEVAWLVVDDGSRDGTAGVARASGADHVVRLKRHRGLAAAFQAGLDAALRAGADMIVTIDADGQFHGSDIPRLVGPLLAGEADVAVGDRDVRNVAYLSWRRRRLQRIGSAVVRRASRTRVSDTTSGFRAYTREAAMGTEVLCRFTYTLDTLIRAGRSGLAIEDVVVVTEPAPRPSRLYSSVWCYLRRALSSICHSYARYAPARLFLPASAAVLVLAAAIAVAGGAAAPALAGAAVLAAVAFHLATVGLLAWLVAESNRLGDAVLLRVRRLELEAGDLLTGVPVAHQPRVARQPTDGRHDGGPSELGPRAPHSTADLPQAAG